jgi:hypothetical protein
LDHKELKEYSCLTYKTISIGWHVLGLERSGAWKKDCSITETHWDRAWQITTNERFAFMREQDYEVDLF